MRFNEHVVIEMSTLLPVPTVVGVPAAGKHLPPCTCLSSPASQTSAPPSRPGNSEEDRVILHIISQAEETCK